MTAVLLAVCMGFIAEPDHPTTMVFPPYGHCMGIYRAGTEQLAMLLGGLVRFDNPQDLACVKLEAWDDPGRSDDDELAVYGVNSGSGHIIYNASMYTLGLYGGEGEAEDRLSSPHGIDAEPDGTVYVADTGNRRVMILGRRGARLRPRGRLSFRFEEPWAVSVNGDGSLCVTDRGGGALYIFDSTGDVTPDTIGLDMPTGVASVSGDRWLHSSVEDPVQYVVVEEGRRLVKLVDGAPASSVMASEFGGRVLCYPDMDYMGNVWVADSVTCQVHKLDPDLVYLDSWGSPGTGDRELNHPRGLAIWRRFGQIFVSERAGARYYWVGTDLRDLELDLRPRGFTLTAVITETSSVSLEVLGSGGEVAAVVVNRRVPTPELSVEWDATDRSGRPLPGGEYTMRLSIKPTYSSRQYFDKTWTRRFTLGPAPEPDPADGGGRRGRR